MKFHIIICIIVISITSCKSSLESFLIVDIKKDGLFGNVGSVETYASKDIRIQIADTSTAETIDFVTSISGKPERIKYKIFREYNLIDTIFEILLSKTIYNQNGNRVEYIEYRTDNILVAEKYIQYNNNSRPYRITPGVIDAEEYKHLKYNYNKDNVLESILTLNINGSFKVRTEYHFFPIKREIIDSTFYENRGLSRTTTRRLTKYGISGPDWVSNKPSRQFDINNNIIVEGEIHYYYDEYDKHGNWIKCTKYYEGPTKGIPVYMRRVIEYY